VLQTAVVTSLFDRFEIISRKCLETVATTMTMERLIALSRTIQEQVSLSLEKWAIQKLQRIFTENVTVESGMAKKQSLIRKVEDVISGMDNQEFSVLFYRSITDTTIVTQANSGIRGFIREVKSTTGNFEGMEHGAGFYRYPIDTVDVESSLLRKLDVFVRIAIQLIAHEFFLGRFLKSKTEIVLKSCITRELTIESKIN
jgi:hypothetical protein